MDEETSVGGGKAASGYLTACPAWPAQGLIPVSPTPRAKKTKTKSKSKTPGLYYGRQQRLTLNETPPWYRLLAPSWHTMVVPEEDSTKQGLPGSLINQEAPYNQVSHSSLSCSLGPPLRAVRICNIGCGKAR